MTTTTTESYRQRQTREKREAKAWWGKPIKVKADDGIDAKLYYEREHEGRVFRALLAPRGYRLAHGYYVQVVAGPAGAEIGRLQQHRASNLHEAWKCVLRHMQSLCEQAKAKVALDVKGLEQDRFIEGLGGLAAARKEHALLKQQANEAGVAYHDAAKRYNDRCASLRTLAEAIAYVESTRLDTATVPT
jgi:hypothetical protein